MLKRHHSRRQCSSSPACSQPCCCFLCLMLQSLVACPISHPAGSAASRHAPNPIFPHSVFCGPVCLPQYMVSILSKGAVPPSIVALALSPQSSASSRHSANTCSIGSHIWFTFSRNVCLFWLSASQVYSWVEKGKWTKRCGSKNSQ